MKDLSVEKNKFVALWVETALWGMFTVLFCICVYVLLYSKKASSKVNKPLLGTAIIMYILCTAHVVNDFARAMVGFIDYEDRGGARAYYRQIWVWSYVFREALYVTNNIVADSLLVYRLHVVWNRDKRIIIAPIVMLIGTAVCGYLAVWGFTRIKPGDTNHSVEIYHWAVALFALSFCTNVIVTSLIAWRIWWTGHKMARILDRKHRRKYSRALVIIVESGAICSIATLIVLIAYVSGTNAVDIAFDPLAQITGIGPTLIIVRVGLGLSTQESTSYYSTAFTTNAGGPTVTMRTDVSGMTGDTIQSFRNIAQSSKSDGVHAVNCSNV